MDIIPFTNYEYEAFTVGSMIMMPNMVDEVTTILTEEDFYYESAREVYIAAVQLNNTGRLDTRTLYAWLVENNKEYLKAEAERMIHSVTSPRLAKEYAKRVAINSFKRKAINMADSLNALVNEFEGYDVAEFMSTISGMVGDMDSDRGGNMTRAVDYFDKHISAKESKEYVPYPKFGLNDMDSWSRGVAPKQLIVLAGRPGTGKTAFALQTAHNISRQDFGAVPVFSMEMGLDELMDRVLSSITGIPFIKLRTNDLTPEEKKMCREIKPKISDQFYMDDKASMDLGYILSQSRKLKRKYGKLGSIVIDYLGLIDNNKRNGESLSEAVGRITKALKRFAREIDTSIFLLVQMNREIEKRSTKRPVLSDLRDSGSIEQDADMVIFLHKDEEKSEQKMHHIDLIVAKGRNTGVRDFELAFLVEVQRMMTKAVYAPNAR